MKALGWLSCRGHGGSVVWATLASLLVAPSLLGQGVAVRPLPRRPEPVPDRYIVQLRSAGADPVAQIQRLAQQHGLSVGVVYRNAIQGFSAMIPPGRVAQVRNDPAVLTVEPDLIVRAVAQTVPSSVERIGATLNSVAAIDGVDTRVDVDVAVIDTGVSAHADLNVVARTDCVDWDLFVVFFGFPATCVDGQGMDGNGHGTHVSGTIGALDNGFGVVGVAPGARLWSVRVLEADGTGYLSWLIAGMDYVAQHAAQIEVANMSLGWVGNSPAARAAVQSAVSKGVVFVAAAGNDRQDIFGPDGNFGTADDFEPAAYPEVATISALADSDGLVGGLGAATAHGPDDTLATFSNFSSQATAGNPVNSTGGGIDFAAPGVDIYSTLPGENYGKSSGTSMATPHAAGAFALYIAANGRAATAAGVAAIRQALIDAAQAQSLWGPVDTHDLDGKREGLVFAGSGSVPVNLAPTITINSPVNGTNFLSGATVLLAGTASDEDGNLTASLSWSSSKDGFLGTGGSLSKVLTDGPHTITASAIDSKGKTGSSSVGITVGCLPTQVTVSSVTYALSRNKRDLSAIVSLRNDCGKPVVGATVSVYITNWTLARVWGGTGTTNASGQETFVVKGAPAGSYSTVVSEITGTNLTWDGETLDNSYVKK